MSSADRVMRVLICQKAMTKSDGRGLAVVVAPPDPQWSPIPDDPEGGERCYHQQQWLYRWPSPEAAERACRYWEARASAEVMAQADRDLLNKRRPKNEDLDRGWRFGNIAEQARKFISRHRPGWEPLVGDPAGGEMKWTIEGRIYRWPCVESAQQAALYWSEQSESAGDMDGWQVRDALFGARAFLALSKAEQLSMFGGGGTQQVQVKQHTRVSKKGTVSQVKASTAKRRKAAPSGLAGKAPAGLDEARAFAASFKKEDGYVVTVSGTRGGKIKYEGRPVKLDASWANGWRPAGSSFESTSRAEMKADAAKRGKAKEKPAGPWRDGHRFDHDPAEGQKRITAEIHEHPRGGFTHTVHHRHALDNTVRQYHTEAEFLGGKPFETREAARAHADETLRVLREADSQSLRGHLRGQIKLQEKVLDKRQRDNMARIELTAAEQKMTDPLELAESIVRRRPSGKHAVKAAATAALLHLPTEAMLKLDAPTGREADFDQAERNRAEASKAIDKAASQMVELARGDRSLADLRRAITRSVVRGEGAQRRTMKQLEMLSDRAQARVDKGVQRGTVSNEFASAANMFLSAHRRLWDAEQRAKVAVRNMPSLLPSARRGSDYDRELRAMSKARTVVLMSKGLSLPNGHPGEIDGNVNVETSSVQEADGRVTRGRFTLEGGNYRCEYKETIQNHPGKPGYIARLCFLVISSSTLRRPYSVVIPGGGWQKAIAQAVAVVADWKAGKCPMVGMFVPGEAELGV